MNRDAFYFSANELIEIGSFVKRIGIISTFIFLAIFSMLFLPWEQTVQGTGKIVAYDPTQRDYELKAPHPGFVKEYFVQENQKVKQGDALCVIEDQDSSYETRLTQKQNAIEIQIAQQFEYIQSLKDEQIDLKKYYTKSIEQFKNKLKQSQNTLKKLDLEVQNQTQNLLTKKRHFKRIQALYKKDLESKKTLEKTKNEYIRAKTMYEQKLLAQTIGKQSYIILENEIEKFSAQQEILLEKNKQSISKAKLTQETLKTRLIDANKDLSRYANRVLKAQKDGVVMRIFHNDKNKLLKQNDSILHFVPEVTQRSLLLKISDFHMPLLKVGEPVRIKFHGWPALQISGWPKITYGTFGGYIHSVEPISHEKDFYYVHVFELANEPWPEDSVLRYGTQASAWIRLDSVPIWYQIWRNMNAAPPNIPQGT
jgi:multidrug efflux pump subunit AcrA (membrane-fusion protein)